MNNHCSSMHCRMMLQHLFHKSAGADHRIDQVIGLSLPIVFSLSCPQQASQIGAMNTAILRACRIIAIDTPLTEFPCFRNFQHVIGAHPLIVMCGIDHSDLWIKPVHCLDDRRCQLKIDVVEVNHIRLEISQHRSHLLFRFPGPDDL